MHARDSCRRGCNPFPGATSVFHQYQVSWYERSKIQTRQKESVELQTSMLSIADKKTTGTYQSVVMQYYLRRYGTCSTNSREFHLAFSFMGSTRSGWVGEVGLVRKEKYIVSASGDASHEKGTIIMIRKLCTWPPPNIVKLRWGLLTLSLTLQLHASTTTTVSTTAAA